MGWSQTAFLGISALRGSIYEINLWGTEGRGLFVTRSLWPNIARHQNLVSICHHIVGFLYPFHPPLALSSLVTTILFSVSVCLVCSFILVFVCLFDSTHD